MVKTRRRGKGNGLFGKTRRHPVIAVANRYEDDGWKVILETIKKRELDLDELWTVAQVDALLSKWADSPRNVDELRRVQKWTDVILDHKSYTSTTKFQKMLHKLKHRSL